MKHLLVGETPNASCAGKPRLWLMPDPSSRNNAATRLLEVAGWDLKAYLRVFDRTNLARGLPPREGKGRRFPMWAAKRAASKILKGARRPGIVVLGKRAARAFGLRDPEWFEWHEVRGQRVAVIPHTTGINRWYNDEGNRELARRFFEEIASGRGGRKSLAGRLD